LTASQIRRFPAGSRFLPLQGAADPLMDVRCQNNDFGTKFSGLKSNTEGH
jgi:hypothetical protein